jgi:WD40 repeat protein
LLYEEKVVPVGPNTIAFSPDGQLLAITGSGQNAMIYIVQTQNHQLVAEGFTESNAYIGRVHWGTNALLVSGGSDGVIHVWQIHELDPKKTLCLKTFEARMNCSRLRVRDAQGLDAAAPANEGTLLEWFLARGAML